MLFQNIKVRVKLGLLVVLTALMLVAISATALLDMRHSLQVERTSQLDALLDTSIQLLETLQTDVENGEISSSEARTEARRLLENMTYGNDDYYFALNERAVMTVHGGDSQQVGRDLSNFQTQDGRPLFRNMVDLLDNNQAREEFSYLWPKAGSSKPQPKLTVVRTFEPWGWVVGTGVYMDDLNAAFMSDVIRIGIATVVALVILIAFSLLIGRSITSPLDIVTRVMTTSSFLHLKLRTHLHRND
ncbi:MAG: cache domain-containing protein [Alteromonadaceae bacterium]|nr:cache domain-containing protein [Alteromonadaceae bacterium]